MVLIMKVRSFCIHVQIVVARTFLKYLIGKLFKNKCSFRAYTSRC